MGVASVKPACDVFRINPSSHGDPFLKPATNACGEGGGVNSDFIGDDHYQVSEFEMITFEASPYTSLKDLIQSSSPTSPSSWLITSPGNCNGCRKDSWREIPIKDPLLQHAAWAYLLPMSADAEGPHRQNLMQKVREECGGIFGCLSEVVRVMIKNWAASFSR